MRYLATHEHAPRGTFDFPIELYYVDPSHTRYEMPFHWHMEHELILVLQGVLRLSVEGEAFELAPGDCMLIADGAIHGGTPEGCIYECLVFDLERFLAGTTTCGQRVALLTEGLLVSEPAVEGAAREAAVSELPASAAASARLVERRPRTVESVNLAAARRVVSVGRGVAAQEDLALVDELAAALEAEVGCTRPVAEGSGWMARERYIGVSGALLKPDLFVAVGLSGQIQHMVGANSAKTIVAVNKDKNAPVFKQCDYGIVADLYEVLPKLSAALGA